MSEQNKWFVIGCETDRGRVLHGVREYERPFVYTSHMATEVLDRMNENKYPLPEDARSHWKVYRARIELKDVSRKVCNTL